MEPLRGEGPFNRGRSQQMTANAKEIQVERMAAVLARHRRKLFEIPGCTGVAIGLKTVAGKETDKLCLTVFVAQKRANVSTGERVPTELEGFPTDVVEQEELRAELTATDPFARYDPMFGGLSVTPWEAPPTWGSIGCFITTTGDLPHHVPAGNYLLTCHHILRHATTAEPRVIQPNSDKMVPPANYAFGDYVAGYRTATQDCAIASVTARGFTNKVPNYPGYPGLRAIQGVGTAVPGDAVYKYGATTKFTKGRVALVHYTPPNLGFQDVILTRSELGFGHVWVAKGDSGSVTIRQSDDVAIALNFAGTPHSVMAPPPPGLPAYPAYFRGFGYDLMSQMRSFAAAGGTVSLAA
jgi:hypothetical protein